MSLILGTCQSAFKVTVACVYTDIVISYVLLLLSSLFEWGCFVFLTYQLNLFILQQVKHKRIANICIKMKPKCSMKITDMVLSTRSKCLTIQ